MKLLQKCIGNRFVILLLIVGVCTGGIYLAGKRLVIAETAFFIKGIKGYRSYQSATSFNLDSLRKLYGHNKKFIKKYELQSLLALSHYPQLQHTYITFYEEEALIPLASRPEPNSMFGKKDKWQYNIIISTTSLDELEPVLLQNIPFNAQVGILGHELAHTVYYLDKDIGDMLLIALNYPFPFFRSQFEKNTDRRAVAHGLGWQLLEYASYARKVLAYDDTYLGSEYYLSPEEIKEQISRTYLP